MCFKVKVYIIFIKKSSYFNILNTINFNFKGIINNIKHYLNDLIINKHIYHLYAFI